MTQLSATYLGGPIFDGQDLLVGYAARFEEGRLVALTPEGARSKTGPVVDLEGGILCPGFVDLQVNGGGGVMFNDAPSVESIETIVQAHRSLGATRILPTLITDTPEKTQAAIEAAISACAMGMRGCAGLHLEGPHLSVARKGAHDAGLIRPMGADDLALLLQAAQKLPCLKVTVAPENTGVEQVKQLSEAGVLVSLGHTDADFDTCLAYAEAGARCVTHLFNAMRQMGNREPGVVGATLSSGALSAGLIADGIHVHPEVIRAAWDAKRSPGEIFLVSDAMAVAGTELTGFALEGREIARSKGRLTLSDGTLAGADLDLTTAIRVMTEQVGLALPVAIRAATHGPATLIGSSARLVPETGFGSDVTLWDMIRIAPDLSAASPVLPM